MATLKYGMYNKLTVDQAIAKAIESTNHATNMVQVAAVKIIIHTAKHGDYTKANALIEGLGDGIRKDSLVEWFVLFGLKADDKGFIGFDKTQVKSVDNLEIAKATMWNTVKRAGNPFKGLDLIQEIERLEKKVAKAMAVAEASEDEQVKSSVVVNMDMLSALNLIKNANDQQLGMIQAVFLAA